MSIPQQGGGLIESRDDLVGYLSDGCKPPEAWRIGTEHEKFGYRLSDHTPLPYEGACSIRAMLEGLRDRFGWAPLIEAGQIIGLTKDGANVSLEPGGQLELSGAPLETIHQTCDEVNTHLAEVRGVLAQPVTYDQCNAYLAEHLPDAEVTFTTSNTQSGRDLLAAPDGAAIAAIVPLEFGEEHQQLCAAADIQNNAQNITRFLVVRSGRDGETFDFERHKTSLLVEPEEDRPGLLYDLLCVFKSHHLNLVRLESRPAGIRPWSYVFFIDFHNNARTPDCLSDLRNDKRRIRVLGSYDTLE